MAGSDVKAKNQTVFTVTDKIDTKLDNNAAVSLEDALDIIGMGRYNYGLYIVCILTVLAMALETFGTSYVVTASTCDLGLVTETKGLISAMPMMGVVLSSHLWGWVADTRGRRAVLLISMLGSFVFSMGCSFAHNWLVLAVFKFVAAFFASASNAVSYALLGECTPRSHRNKLVMLMSSGLMFAQGVMSINAYPILRLDFDIPLAGIRYKPWRLLEQVFGAWSGLPAILLLLFVKESPKFHASRGDLTQSLRILGEIFAINTGKSIEEFPVKSLTFFEESSSSKKQSNVLKSMWDQTTPLFRPPLLKKTLVITYIVILVYSISPAFLMWMPTITNAFSRASAEGYTNSSFCELMQMAKKKELELSYNSTTIYQPPCLDRVEDLTFITLTAFSASMAIINAINSYLIKYLGKRSIVIFLHLVGGVCGIILPWVYNTNTSLVVFFLFQANLISMGLTTGFTVEVYPTYLRAMAVCLTMMIGRGSSFLVISYVGVLLETHCEATIYSFGGVILSGALVGLMLPSELKRDRDKTESVKTP